MRFFWWKLRYAFWIWRGCRCNCAWDFAWDCAVASDAFDDEDYTAREAAESEMSYWGD